MKCNILIILESLTAELAGPPEEPPLATTGKKIYKLTAIYTELETDLRKRWYRIYLVYDENVLSLA